MSLESLKLELENARRCALFNFRKSTRSVNHRYDEILHECGLRGTQFTILAVTTMLDKPSIGQLAENLGMDRTTLTRNLKPLVKANFVAVSRGHDRRKREVRLTENGVRILAQALPLWKQVQQEFIEYMGPERFDALLSELRYAAQFGR